MNLFDRLRELAAFDEKQHPRGQPANKGEFVKKGSAKQPASKTIQHYNRMVNGVLQRMHFYDSIVDVSDDPRRNFPSAKRFYVYIYFLKNGKPWYVGKGTGQRAKSHRRQFKEKLIESDKVFAGMTEKQAWDLEKALVAKIGTVHEGNGPLSNSTEGGPGIHPISGVPRSPEARKRTSEAMRGVPKSPEHRKHIGDAQRGRHHSLEAKKHISDAKRGMPIKPHSLEQRKHLSDALHGPRGPLSPEHRQHIGDAKRGNPLSSEHKQRIGDAKRGVPREQFSPEWKKHIGDAQRGKHHSPETIKRMKNAQRRRRAAEGN